MPWGLRKRWIRQGAGDDFGRVGRDVEGGDNPVKTLRG